MKKKSIMTGLVLTLLFLNVKQGYAQKSSKDLSFGFGLEAGVTAGDFKDVYNVAAGITVRSSYKFGPGFATLTSGGILFLPKNLDGEDLKAGLLIPVKAGYKYIFKDHFFVMGELGYGSMKYYFNDLNGAVASISQGGFIYAPSLGIQFGSMEIGIQYESTSLPGASLSAGLVRLGFNF